MARRRGSLLSAIGSAAVIAGIATVVSKIQEKAKNEGREFLDVAKEKVDGIVADAKSGELQNNISEFVDKTAESIKSGELKENLVNFTNKTIEEVKSGEFKEKVMTVANNAKDAVIDLMTVVEEADEEPVDAPIDSEEPVEHQEEQ